MDSFLIDDFLSSPQFSNDSGSRVYLYRLLRMMASRESSNLNNGSQVYQAARKLAQQMSLDTPEQLKSLISDLGIGELRLDISSDSIAARLTQARLIPDNATGGEISSCEFERGLIDGSLELITGMPVETAETGCISRGDKYCKFDAVREEFKGFKRFVPGSLTGGSISPPHTSGLDAGKESGPALSRSWFLDLAARELARSRRHGRPLSFLYLDIDDLGQVNASRGRSAGDRLIYIVAAALSKCCRAEDFLWYPGEDEFALVLAETNLEESEAVARRLIDKIRAEMSKPDSEAGTMVSIGCSSFPDNADNVNDLLAASKSALYQAKSQGKGQAVAAVDACKGGTKPVAGEAEPVGEGTMPPVEGGEEGEVLGTAEPEKREMEPLIEPAVEEDTMLAPYVFAEPAQTNSGTIGGKDARKPSDEQVAEEQIAVIIASENPLLLAGLGQIISDENEMEVLDTIDEPSRLASSIADLKPDLVIADLLSVSANDFEAIKSVRGEKLTCKIALIAAEVDKDVVKLAVELAVEGVILQDSSPEEILSALRSIINGETVQPEEVRAAIDELVDNKRMLGDLSEREQQVLKLMAEGKTNSQISDELYITVNTVRFHLANIYQKLGVSNRTEAANYYLRQGINPDTPDVETP